MAIHNGLAHHDARNQLIAADIADAAWRGQCSLALTAPSTSSSSQKNSVTSTNSTFAVFAGSLGWV
ncbi:hypothetical protein [Streptomyces sp. NPDC002520]